MQEIQTTHESHEMCLRVFVGKFLGFLVHHRGISVDPAKATMKKPTTVKELKSFLRRVSYIRRFEKGDGVHLGNEKTEGLHSVDHESLTHSPSTSAWATPVAVLSIKLPSNKGLAST